MTLKEQLRRQSIATLKNRVTLQIEHIKQLMQHASKTGATSITIEVDDILVPGIKLWCNQESITCLGDTYTNKPINGIVWGSRPNTTRLKLYW